MSEHTNADTSEAPSPSVEDLEIEVRRTRAELAQTADALAARLSPQHQAEEAKAAASKVLRDAVGTDPAADPDNQLRSRLILAGGVVGIALVVTWLIRRH